MVMANTGVNMQFNADTRAASANIAALEARLASLHRAMAQTVASNMFNTGNIETRLSTQIRSMDDLSRAIQRNKISYRQFADTIRGTNGLLEYQQRLHQANISSMRQIGNGQMMVGLDTRAINSTNNALAQQAVQLATASAAGRAFGTTMMNVGKNMAFMGRQSLLSVTAPIVAIGAGTAVVAYQIDKQLTNIVKLSGDSSNAMQSSSDDIRQASLDLARDISQNFGIAVKETLSLQEHFAALGKTGTDLRKATEATSRLMRLGDLDADTAIKFSNTMQTVFGQTNEQLENSINLINEFENTTVLTMGDVSDAMPKIGPIVDAMGGDIKDVLIMLEALKRGGIDAVEGANSVKSVATSLLRPTVKLEKLFQSMTGQSLAEVVKRNNTDMIAITKEIGNLTKDWSKEDKFKLFGQIAGKEQIARFLQLAENLASGNANVTRTIGKSEQELKAIADQEIKAIMESASAKFDVQVQRAILMAEQIGAKVLPVITGGFSAFLTIIEKIGGAIGKGIEMLGPFGDILKYVGVFAAGAAVAFGPLLLIMSALGLMTGGIIKGVAMVGTMGARIQNFRAGNGFTAPRVLTTEQRAEQVALRAQQQAQREAITSTQQLEAAIRRLTTAYTGVSAAASGAANATSRYGAAAGSAAAMSPLAQVRAAQAGTLPGQTSPGRVNGFIGGIQGGEYRPRGMGGRTHDMDDYATRQAARLAEEQDRVAQSAARMQMGLGVAAVAVGVLGSQMAGTNQNAQYLVVGLTTALMVFSMMPGVIMAAIAKLKLFGSVMVALIASTSGGGKLVTAFKSLGAVIAANAMKLGLIGVGIAAVGAVAYTVYRSMTAEARKFKEENDKIGKSVEGWAKVLKFTELKPGQTRDSEGNAVDTRQSRILAIQDDENLGALVERLRRESRNIAQLRSELFREAAKLAAQGLKPEDIEQAIEDLMSAANIAPEIQKELMITFKNFSVVGPDGQPLDVAASDKIKNVFERGGHTASYWEQQGFGKGWLGTGFGPGGGAGGTGLFSNVDENDLSNKAKQDIDDMMTTMISSLEATIGDPAAFSKVWQKWSASFNQSLDVMLSKLKPEAAAKIREVGLMDAEIGDMFAAGEINKDQFNQLVYAQNMMIETMDRLKERFPVGDEFAFMFENMADASVMAAAQMKVAIMTPAQATDAFKAKVAAMGEEWTKLSPAVQASLVNYYRAAAGLEALTVEQVTAAVAARNLGIDMEAVGKAAQGAQPPVEELGDELVDKEVDWNLEFSISGNALGMPGDPSEMFDMTLTGYKNAMQKVQDDIFTAASDNAQANFDARIAELKRQQDAQIDALDAEAEAMDERYEAEEKAMDKAQAAEEKAFDQGWEDRIKAEKQVYEDRIKAIEDAQEAEDELERQRQRNSEREAARIRYLASLMNANIDMNIAIASGDLDEAARISINQQQGLIDYNTEVTDREAGWKKEDEDRGRKTAIELIREEEDARMEMLENQKEMEREAMEERHAIEREMFDRRRDLERKDLEAKKEALQAEHNAKIENENAMFAASQKRMQMELDTLRATLPRTTAEMNAQRQQIEQIYAAYGVQLTITGDQWAQIVGNSLTHRVAEARNQMSNDKDWEMFGTRVSEGVSRGAFNMNSAEFNDFIRTGNMPGLPAPRHEGGPISRRGGYDKYASRGGIPMNAPIRSDEQTILAQKGEFMLNRNAHRTYGTENLNALNSGRAMIVRHAGGPVGVDNIGALGAAVQASMWGALTSRATLATGLAMSSAKASGSSYGGGGAQDSVGPGAGNSAFINSMMAVRDKVAPSLSMTSGWRFTDSGYHSKGMAADFSDGSSSTPAMQRFAKHIADNYAQDTLQLIHHPFGRNIGQGVGFVGDGMGFYGAGTMLGHQDHVHWAVNKPVNAASGGAPGSGGGISYGLGPNVNIEEIEKKFPQYAKWTTAGIAAYRDKMAAIHGFSSEDAITGDWKSGNKDFYVREIVDEAKRRGLTKKAARIALMTAMQESNIRILANPRVPESFNYPHDGVGYDHDSVGIFQQRQAGWGTLAQRMNARGSAGLFYNKLAQFDYNSMNDNDAAQRVQVSGTPSAYGKWFGQADSLANQYFDNGGLAYGRGFMPKNTIKPERVLDPAQTRAFEDLIPLLDQRLMNKGIISFDNIINALRDDNIRLLADRAVKAVSGIIKDSNITIGDFIVQGDINGVDELEARLREHQEEIMRKIKEEKIREQRRLGGR